MTVTTGPLLQLFCKTGPYRNEGKFAHVEELTCALLLKPERSAASEINFSCFHSFKTNYVQHLPTVTKDIAICHAHKGELVQINITG